MEKWMQTKREANKTTMYWSKRQIENMHECMKQNDIMYVRNTEITEKLKGQLRG